jgi:hypothetical protein
MLRVLRSSMLQPSGSGGARAAGGRVVAPSIRCQQLDEAYRVEVARHAGQPNGRGVAHCCCMRLPAIANRDFVSQFCLHERDGLTRLASFREITCRASCPAWVRLAQAHELPETSLGLVGKITV